MKIAVLMGGTSAEREVSLASGQGIVKALRERGHEVWTVDTARGFVPPEREADLLPEGVHAAPPGDLEGALDPIQLADVEQIRAADVAFLALHGGAGEDGTIQALLDLMGVRYTGSGPLGSGIAMDKDVSKRLFRDAQVPTLPWRVARAPDFRYDPDTIEDLIGFPCIVKPSKQGSSVGITVVGESDQLASAVEEARKYDSEVMIERYAKGRELTVGILGDQALPPVEIRPKKGIYDYHSKYTPGMTEYFCPAPLEEEVVAQMQAYALRAFRVLKLRGYARIDFILAREQLFCLEANTLPGMTATSLLPKAAAAMGIDYPELCERIVRLAGG
ncbi:D-alanine--D-alanine ligase [Longimicrobium sp.]|uniref:D-alanine--D-alanine ligase n=1 Tax=Longimicrobium sp. TaxID=2029185 RepID=UPI002B7294C1|nr:D-alanine--D-alanine ligase [Longimicrobium sp.]HSU12725.1 D-alanine--D-alanine ligase [Longimicrobium sp.]